MTKNNISGNDAIDNAEKRAAKTAKLNISPLKGNPSELETANLRVGPEIHADLLGILPLVGVWRGTGKGFDFNFNKDFEFGQQIIVSHYGQNKLQWNSQIWKIENNDIIHQELGFIDVSNSDTKNETINFWISTSNHLVEVFQGKPLNQISWEFIAKSISGTSKATPIRSSKRLYGVLPNGNLGYVEEIAINETEWKPIFSAELTRYIG